jgi:hypothetical protein
VTLTPANVLIPFFLKARAASFETSSSSSGAIRGSASRTVTSAPNARYTVANSKPMAPAPMITTDEGSRSRTSASSLVMTWSETSILGSSRGREPVARTTS